MPCCRASLGLELLVSLRRDPQWSELPMVVVTGNDTLLEDDCQSYLGAHEGVARARRRARQTG